MSKGYNYTRETEYDASAPIRKGFDVTLSGSLLPIPTRAITVSVDCTVTGIFSDDTTSHTTHTLKANTLYPFVFKVISAASNSATVKGYA